MQIIPMRELKNTVEIERRCAEENGPVFVTKNGYGRRFITSWGLNNFVKDIVNNPKILTKMQKNMAKNHNEQAIQKLYELTEDLLKNNKSNN